MAIENTVSSDHKSFDPRSSIIKSVFDCRLSGVIIKYNIWLQCECSGETEMLQFEKVNFEKKKVSRRQQKQ